MIWTASRNYRGYGQVKIRGKMVGAHRVSFLWHHGEIPDGLELDHLCRNTACVNPSHLEPVTGTENKRRSIEVITTRNLFKPLCPNSHQYTIVRVCKTCKAEGQRRRRAG